MSIRRRTLTRDAKGSFRPYIDWKTIIPYGGVGKENLIQVRFNLGKDEREAYLRYAAI